MRVSDKVRVRQRRFVHGVLILISFSLMFLGKADLAALRNLRMGSNDFLAPIVDVVSAPIRGIETMIEGVRTVASLRAENVRLQGENDLLKRWRRRAEILESENRQLRSVTGAVTVANRTPITARAVIGVRFSTVAAPVTLRNWRFSLSRISARRRQRFSKSFSP